MADEVLQKALPSSLEAEQSIIGAIFLDSSCIMKALDEKLSEEDFYFPQNKEIFSVMCGLFNESKPVDVITVTESLKTRGTFDGIGGLPYISYVGSFVPTTQNISSYIQIVKEKAQLRTLIMAANKISSICYDETNEPWFVMEDATKILYDILSQNAGKGYTHIRPVLVENMERLSELAKNGSDVTGVPTGFIDLDHRLSGLQKGNLVLIAARPGMGKTSLGLNILQYAATRANVPSVIFSLEMSKEEIANRILSGEAMVSSGKMRSGSLDAEDFRSLAQAIGPLSNAPIYIDDTAGVSLSEIRARCKRLKIEKNIGLIVIDYLQLMQGERSRKSDNRQNEISDISRGLKMLAKELDLPVVCLSQLSRAPEARTDHRPMLSDLRESGAIEQDADIVMFIYKDVIYNPDTEQPNVAECIVAKHRNGETGTVKLVWLGELTKFANYTEES